MLIIPAIDIQDGCVVRLTQGKPNFKKIYSRQPLAVAKHWVKQGARLIHVVDLDGAFSGKPKNKAVVKEIAKAVPIPIEFGGGLRNRKLINELLRSGVYRVVLGTKAIEDKKFLKEIFREFKERIIVSLDASEGRVQVRGWQKSTSCGMAAKDIACDLKEIGFKEFIYTDVLKDGTLKGPNIKETKKLLKESKMKIIASGGVSSLADIAKLKLLEKDGLSAVIVGKALYEGRFTLAQALKSA